jgi:hypothetical protein
VRGLLLTRFESNAVILEQLIRHVGQEALGQQGGSVTVHNTSCVSAHPVSARTHTHTADTFSVIIRQILLFV